jgi:hypothetical protein
MDKIIAILREQLNIIDINRDSPNEFSKERLDLRNGAIENMEKIMTDIKSVLKQAELLHEKAININKINNQRVTTWKLNVENLFNPPNMICEDIGGVQVIARKVAYMEDVGSDLCFMPSVNRFAVRFAGCLMVGNVGNIYDICSNPERVKECRFSNANCLPSGNESRYKTPKCSKTDGECRFYHNPLIFPSSKESRNFFATCSQYISPYSENIDRSNYLTYGSRQYLKDDLKKLSPEETRRFDDYVAHLVICWIILKRKAH